MPAPDFSPDEMALLAAIHADPRSDLPRLVYADFLDDQSRDSEAKYLRLAAAAPRFVVGGRSEVEVRELTQGLGLWKALRTARVGLDPAWLKAVGDRGRVGELLSGTVSARGRRAYFGLIVHETPKTVVVHPLQKVRVSGDHFAGAVRPVIPAAAEQAILVAARAGDRFRPGKSEYSSEEHFHNGRQFLLYSYWDGSAVEEFCD